MKIEYIEKGGCVAYIDAFGTLVVKDYLEQGKKESATGFTEGGCVGMSWEPEDALKKFYKGDKVSITF